MRQGTKRKKKVVTPATGTKIAEISNRKCHAVLFFNN